MFRAIPTLLDDGTTKLCIEKEAFREELKYVFIFILTTLFSNFMFQEGPCAVVCPQVGGEVPLHLHHAVRPRHRGGRRQDDNTIY